MKNTPTFIDVRVRNHGYSFTARAGRGKQACEATCTSDAQTAAERAGGRYLGQLHPGLTKGQIKATLLPMDAKELSFAPFTYRVEAINLDPKGGAL